MDVRQLILHHICLVTWAFPITGYVIKVTWSFLNETVPTIYAVHPITFILQNDQRDSNLDPRSSDQVFCTPVPCVCSTYVMSLLKGNRIISVDENSPYVACPPGSVGGQCVALAKCECNAAHTSHWIPGRKVKDACKEIKYGTVIATFDGPRDQYQNRATDHTAVFVGCFVKDGVHHIAAYGQGCSYHVTYQTFRRGDRWHDRFYEVTCDRRKTSCDSPTAHVCRRRFRYEQFWFML